MATHDYVIANASGAAVRSDLNNALAAIVSNNSNTTEPATTYAYQSWADTTAGLMKIRNSTNDAWVSLFNLDGSSLGPGKVTFGATEVVFNDAGNDVDFRIEGDNEANLFFVDAGNDRIGIGTASPTYGLLDVRTTLASTSYGADVARFNNVDPGGGAAQTTFISIGTAYTDDHEGVVRIGAAREGTSNKASIVFHTSDTTSTSSEKARLDNSGRLGIGTSSPNSNSKLHIAGANSTNYLTLENTTAADGDGTRWSYIVFEGTQSGGEVTSLATLNAEHDGSADDEKGRLVFKTNDGNDGASPTERMRIDSAGRLLTANAVGKSFVTSTNQIVVSPDGTSSANTGNVGIESHATSTSTRHHISLVNPNGVVGSISTNASATAYNTSSDYRLKENVTPVTDGITRLQQLKPSRFNFISDPDKTVDGFIAHEVQDIVPEAITGEKDAIDDEGNPIYQGIDQSKLVPLLTAALQEAIAKIETLETKVAALEAQ